MKSALSTKVVDENLVVVDSIKLESYKTKAVVEMLKHLVLRVRLSSLQQSLTRLLSRVQPTFLALRQLL